MKNIAIIGSGSWGVALAIHLAKLGNKVKIWSFSEEERDIINNEKNNHQNFRINFRLTCFHILPPYLI